MIARVAALLAVVNVAAALALESDRLFPRSARHLAATGRLADYLDVPNRRYLEMAAGFSTLDAAAVPTDSVLYAGTDDSWMYAAWGPRFSRHVEGVRDAAHAQAQIETRMFRFLVVETAAARGIRTAAAAAADRAGYEVLEPAEGRTVYVRGDSPVIEPTTARRP